MMVWRCKDCLCEHFLHLDIVNPDMDLCPNCDEMTEHEFVEWGTDEVKRGGDTS